MSRKVCQTFKSNERKLFAFLYNVLSLERNGKFLQYLTSILSSPKSNLF